LKVWENGRRMVSFLIKIASFLIRIDAMITFLSKKLVWKEGNIEKKTFFYNFAGNV
jgi:hypothetical protein